MKFLFKVKEQENGKFLTVEDGIVGTKHCKCNDDNPILPPPPPIITPPPVNDIILEEPL